MAQVKDLQIVYRNVDDLIPYARNARTHSEEQITKLASSIKEFGFTDPIELDGENGILSGHGRVMAAKKLGLKQVPCVDLNGLTPAQKKAYILAANRLALDAGWDEDLLEIEFSDLQAQGFDVGLTGFTPSELDDLFGVADEKNPYTDKVDVPQYEVQGTNPGLAKCLDTAKADELLAEIETADITTEEREFLRKAATRHYAFHYANVAEYYANASKEMQRLMERSALVIIDFDNAMRDGFVRMSKDLKREAGLSDDAA